MTVAHISAVTTGSPIVRPLTILEPALGLAGPAYPRPLPPLEHRFRGPTGAVRYPAVVSGFAADEDGGFASLSGSLPASEVEAHPEVYTDGAQWLVTDPDTGETVAAGDLLPPAIAGRVAAMKADGWAKRLARVGERYLYQVRAYGSIFVPKHSEPFGPSGQGYLVQDDDFEISTDGALRWTMKKANSQAWSDGDNDGFVAYFGGLAGGVTSIAGHISCSLAGAPFKVRAVCGADPTAALPSPQIVHNFNGGGATEVDFSLVLAPAGPVLIIDVANDGGGAPSRDVTITITQLRLNGIAPPGDTFTSNQVALDIAGRLGLAAAVSASPYNVLPLDAGAGGTAADVLDLAALVGGADYRVTGTRLGAPRLEFFDAGATVWEVIDPEFPVEPVPQPTYDSVLVPYLLSNGKATDVLEVVAAQRLPVPRAYGPVDLPDPLPNADVAAQMGAGILRMVSVPRFAGRVQFSRVLDERSRVSTCHGVHSGDALYLPNSGGVIQRIKALTRSGEGVDAELDDEVAALTRYLARYRRLRAIRYQLGA